MLLVGVREGTKYRYICHSAIKVDILIQLIKKHELLGTFKRAKHFIKINKKALQTFKILF